MATSGTITGTTANKYITAKVVWTETATSATANTSTVTATLYYKKSSSSTAQTRGTLKYTLTVNGSTTSGSVYVTLACNDTWVQIVQKTYTISHKSDGSKSISISATGYISGTTLTSTSLSGTATLTTLDRTAPTITISSTSVTNTSITVTATADVSCNNWQYSTNGGSSYTTFKSGSATSVTTTISGLTANKTYSLRIRAYKVSNNISAYASKSVTTLGASSITSAASKTMSKSGTACKVVFTPYSSSYYYTLTFTVGDYSVTTERFCPGQTTSYTYTGYSFVTSEWAPYITDATSATCTVTLTTYASSSTTTVMGTATKTFTLKVPSSVVPSVSEISLEEAADDLPAAFVGIWVQSISKAAITVTAEGIYGSTITEISVTANGTTTTGSSDSLSLTTDVLTTSGTNEIVVTVTDSRGREATETTTITVVAYYTPTVSLSLDSSGTTLTAEASGGVASVSSCNTCTVKFTIVAVADSSNKSTAKYSLGTSSSDYYSQSHTVTLDTLQSETFRVTVTVTDEYTSTTVTKTTGVITLSLYAGGNGAAFFKEADSVGMLEVNGNLVSNGYIYTTPGGTGALTYGRYATALGNYATAIGRYSNATGDYSTAMGHLSNAYGNYGVAIGRYSNAIEEYSTALGHRANAVGNFSVAVGRNANAFCDSSIAVGENVDSNGESSIVIGRFANAVADNAIVIGRDASGSAEFSVAIGENITNSGYSSIALGRYAEVSGNYSVAIGRDVVDSGDSSVAVGRNADSTGNYSIAIGNNAVGSAENYAIAVGDNCTSSGYSSVAVGRSADSNGEYSVAVGRNAYASGVNAIVLGQYANATGDYSLALGKSSQASATNSTALGRSAVCANENGIQLGNASSLSSLTCKVSLTTTSDIRDKADITEIDDGSTEFLKRIKAIRYVYNGRSLYIDEDSLSDEDRAKKSKYGLCAYDKVAWGAGTKKGSRIRVGVSAQEVQQALAEVYGDSAYGNLVNDNLFDFEDVPEDVESQLAVNYDGFVPFLIKAIQELDERVTKLEGAIGE